MKATFLTGTLVVVATTAAVIWLPRSGRENPDLGDDGTSAAGTNKTSIHARGPDKLSGFTPPQSNTYLANPADEVDRLVQSQSGNRLAGALSRAGKHYATMGTDAVKEFILALPPGAIGKTALGTAIANLEGGEREMIRWLATEVKLSDEWQYSGIDTAATKWALEDFGEVTAFITNSKDLGLDDHQKFDLMRVMLDVGAGSGATDAELLSVVDMIEDKALRKAAWDSPQTIEVRLRQSTEKTLKELVSTKKKADRDASLHSLGQLLSTLDHREQVIESLGKLKFAGRNEWISRYVGSWARKDLNAAMSYVGSISEPKLRDAVVASNWSRVAKYDREASWQWIQSIQDPALRSKAEKSYNKTIRN